ncbi:MAG: DNA-processing protein DprA [Fusobacteriota bacterium]
MKNWFKLKKAKLPTKLIRLLMENNEKYEDIFKKGKEFYKNNYKLKEKYITKIFESQKINIKKEMDKLIQKRIKFLTYNDSRYPRLLKNISKPPLFLYYKGNLDIINEKTIGVVGTRKSTDYGESAAYKITKELVDSGVTIVSGLAAGIDAIGHSQALKNNGKTIAVVGSGLDVIYPKENRRIWEKVEKNGLIFSEYPPETPPYAWNFPKRNRIIVGLSRGIMVAESYKKGGSLITAELAVEENRDVFAVPGFISYPSFQGCNNLIKDNKAHLISTGDDILEEFGWDKIDDSEIKSSTNLTDKEKLIYRSLIVEKSLDELILETSFSASDLLVILTEMEIKGYAKSIPGGKYKRKDILG